MRMDFFRILCHTCSHNMRFFNVSYPRRFSSSFCPIHTSKLILIKTWFEKIALFCSLSEKKPKYISQRRSGLSFVFAKRGEKSFSYLLFPTMNKPDCWKHIGCPDYFSYATASRYLVSGKISYNTKLNRYKVQKTDSPVQMRSNIL